jgi:hypothetical protein
MDHRFLRRRSTSCLLVAGCLAGLAGPGCGGTRVRGTAGGGAGGATAVGEGGASGAGAAGAGGGAMGGSGGGGSGGIVVGGAGGGTTTPTTTCGGDGDCAGATPRCEPVTKLCAECVVSSDCASGAHCYGNRCVNVAACTNSRDCSTGQVCDSGRGLCVECTAPTDCPSGQMCVLDRCVVVQTCQASEDCNGKLCDTGTKSCVSCLADTDCTASNQHCVLGGCRVACATDAQCTGDNRLCDTTTSTCVQCRGAADCPAATYCEGGACKADICDATQSTCAGDAVSACNDTGNGWATPKACAAGQSCTAYGGVATCGGALPDGGPAPGDAGPSPGDSLPTGCTTATAAPCTSLPKFGGSQTLDGDNGDFCDVPSFQFGVANAAANHNYNNVPNSQLEVVTAQVAWSATTGIHAFFNVKDTSVQTVNMADPSQAIDKAYQGDSIELFITSSDNVTGLTASDNNSLHITVPANGPAVLVKTSGGGSATHTALPTSQYFQLVTATGYVIELQLPWPGNAPSAGGRIRFDLALNSADKTFGNVDDMRDAQLVFYLGGAGGSTSCPNNSPDAWCDDRTWCSTTLQP